MQWDSDSIGFWASEEFGVVLMWRSAAAMSSLQAQFPAEANNGSGLELGRVGLARIGLPNRASVVCAAGNHRVSFFPRNRP